MLESLRVIFGSIRWQDVLDIAIVAWVIYYFLILIKETRVMQMLVGLFVLLVGVFIAQKLEMYTINWILQQLWAVWIVAFVILFQPELRQTLVKIGQRRFFTMFFKKQEAEIYQEIIRAVSMMVRKKIGGLIVLGRGTSLKEYVDTGTHMDSEVSADLLMTIFSPKTPLHDGAVVIKGDRILAAGCILPLSQNQNLDKSLGLRHRAAIGVTEETDAMVVVVSEELLSISLARAGKLTPPIGVETLEEMLVLYSPSR